MWYNLYVTDSLTLNPSKSNVVGTTRCYEPFEPCVISQLEPSFLWISEPQWGSIFSGLWGTRRELDLPSYFDTTKSNFVQTYGCDLCLVLANNWSSGTTVLWKVNKFGLRSSSRCVLSAVWVPGTGSQYPHYWWAPSLSICYNLSV
jgi:hypothetical protein